MNWNPNKPKGTNVPPPSRLPHAPKHIRCPNCNAPLRPNQRQCEYCGTWFEMPETEQIIFYADGKPYEIAERVNDLLTANEVRRMYLNEQA